MLQDKVMAAGDAAAGECGPWLPGGEPQAGRIARACLRSDADTRAIEQVQPEDLLPGRTTYECISAAAALEPAKPALIQLLSADLAVPPRIITYAEMMQRIVQAANLFSAVSGSERPSVALILPMVPEALIATWAAQTAGIACPINPYLEERVVVSIMNAARATVLVTSTAKFGSGVWDKLEAICAQVPTLRRVLIVESDDQASDFMRALESYPADRFVFEPTDDPHAEVMYLPTGGTTGAPKLVRMTHRGQLLNAWMVGSVIGPERDGVVGHAMPNFHVGGLNVIALRTMLYGQTLLTLTTDGFRNQGVIRNFWDIARHYRMTSVLATPTTAAALLAVPDVSSEGHSIVTFNCGASTVPLELMRAFHKRFGIWLREIWGMSEIHGVVTMNRNDGQQPLVGSVGSCLPYHTVKAFEVDASNTFLRECAPGERGVLCVTGPGVTPGYVDASVDGEFFVKGAPGGTRWANTGDLGAFDAQGFAWIFGRAKELIIRGGHNIDPRLIEEVLVCHPGVQTAAAIGRPDAAKGEMPIAYVQAKAGCSVAADELLQLCRERVQERAAVPVEIIVIDQMPLTAVGKISKPALRVDAMIRVSRNTAAAIVGESGSIDVGVDESGRRPRVVLTVMLRLGDPAVLSERLRQAFQQFEFEVLVEIINGASASIA
ncbi:AMP-binding protein [Aromatoleum diolicum]|uniref:AMP-binding protein n=2 Tax=Aromatoleum diolicum TaxID=75796 RepID=A0ABX1QDX8_9RHOO|nr:AMP-binding protein [Aromatoleum diolicum]